MSIRFIQGLIICLLSSLAGPQEPAALPLCERFGLRVVVDLHSPPGGQRLKDLIDIFEAHGWDWSYHAFREWDGWSVEYGADAKDHGRARTPTDRERLLRSWFAQNLKPAG